MKSIFNGHWGGLSDSKYSGIAGSFYRCVGIDAHSSPGILKVRQALVKDSGSTVTADCRVALAVSSGETFWFSYTDGKIWRRSTAGVWLLVHTTTPAAGGAGCLGAAEFGGYIYWATESRLHRIPIANIATEANWTANAVEDWATFTVTDSEFHPMIVQSLKLFIGDGNLVAEVSGATGAHAFTADALDLRTPFRVKTMIDYDIDILIGTFVHDNVNKTEVIRWDASSTSWTGSDQIDESGINAFIRDDNFLYVQAGKHGRIYYYDGRNLIPDKRIPGDWSPYKTAEVYPQAVATHMTVPVFGLSNVLGNPALQGVYSFGSYSKNYNKVMDLSYPVSSGLSGVQIGAVLAVGEHLLVSWKYGATYGVDALDWAFKYADAYIETMVLTPAQTRHFLKAVKDIFINYNSLPTGTGITITYKKKHEVDYVDALEEVTDSKKMQIKTKDGTIPEVAALQLRFDVIEQNDNQAFTAATSDLITSAAHGLANGDIVTVATSNTLPTGLSANTDYYVIEKTDDTFKLSATSGGSAVDITGTGTGTHTWYRAESPEVESIGYSENIED